MPAFLCERCGTVDNTAYGQFHRRNSPRTVHEEDLGKALCSACRKDTFPDGSKNRLGGKWHNRFKREYLDLTKFENRLVNGLQAIVHIEDESIHYSDHLKDEPQN